MKQRLRKVLLSMILGVIALIAVGQAFAQDNTRKFSYQPLRSRQDLKNLVMNNRVIAEEYSKNLMLMNNHYRWGFEEFTLSDLYIVFDEAELVKVTDRRMVRVGFMNNGQVVYGSQATIINPGRIAVVFMGVAIGYLDCGNTILPQDIQSQVTFQNLQPQQPVRLQSDYGVDFRNANSQAYNSGYQQPVGRINYVLPPTQKSQKLTVGQGIIVGVAIVAFGSFVAYALTRNNKYVPDQPYTTPPPIWEPGGGEGWLDKAVSPPGINRNVFSVGIVRSF